jgi:hypothetical protein
MPQDLQLWAARQGHDLEVTYCSVGGLEHEGGAHYMSIRVKPEVVLELLNGGEHVFAWITGIEEEEKEER